MAVCLSHKSADMFLESLAQSGLELEPASAGVLGKCVATEEEVSEIRNELPIATTDGVEVLVANDNRRRSNRVAVSHKWTGKLPDGAIMRVDEGLYVSSPEFCLLQQASELDFVHLCQMLGRYLATAAVPVDKGNEDRLVERGPLLTEEDLSVFVNQVGRVRGAGALRKAMAYTCANAASPMETDLQLVLCLPYSMGGFHIKLPSMNYGYDLDEGERLLCGRDSCRVDLCWPGEAYGLEYQGKGHEKTIGSDIARHYALMKKIHLDYVAAEQMGSAVQMDFIAREVARCTKSKIYPNFWPSIDMIQRLLERLRMGHIR